LFSSRFDDRAGRCHRRVVGNGTPTSCTQSALQAQLSTGGTVDVQLWRRRAEHFDRIGDEHPFTFPKITIDGNDTITLDGTGTTSGILSIFGSSTVLADVTFKHITFANATSPRAECRRCDSELRKADARFGRLCETTTLSAAAARSFRSCVPAASTRHSR